MEYKTYKTQLYIYSCEKCGNEFSRTYQCEPFECHSCHGYGTFKEEIVKIDELHQFCTICNLYFKTSIHLNEVFKNEERARWLANMVMHYRHDHLSSWDSTWGRNGYANRFLKNVDYDTEKIKVNERAKRQILRKCKNYLIKNGFNANDILKLQNTEPKTTALYDKILGYDKKAA